MSIIIPFLIISVVGGLLGLGLSVADKKLAIAKDERLLALEEALPGANCGGCGFSGCSGYAEAVHTGKAEIGLCAPGGEAVAKKMAAIMGKEAPDVERRVAHVFCSAPPAKLGKDYSYDGLQDCNAAAILFGGPSSCKEGCVGLGSCIAVCPAGAIERLEDGRVHVRRELCIGCGKCEKVCPHHVIRLVPYAQRFFVDCNSHEKGAVLRKYCESGCIGCGICEKKFPLSGFRVDSLLASAPASSSDEAQAEAALAACPRHVIHKAT